MHWIERAGRSRHGLTYRPYQAIAIIALITLLWPLPAPLSARSAAEAPQPLLGATFEEPQGSGPPPAGRDAWQLISQADPAPSAPAQATLEVQQPEVQW